MKKLLRKIGGGIKKVVKVVAKPFKKIMGFIGRLGWVGTLAMMFAMPYLSSFWGSMTKGMSSFIGGTGAGGSTAAQASAQTVAQETAKGVAKDVFLMVKIYESKKYKIDITVGGFNPVLWQPQQGNWHPTYSLDIKFKN